MNRLVIVTKHHPATETVPERIVARSSLALSKPFKRSDSQNDELNHVEAAQAHMLSLVTMRYVKDNWKLAPISEPLPDKNQWVHIFEEAEK